MSCGLLFILIALFSFCLCAADSSSKMNNAKKESFKSKVPVCKAGEYLAQNFRPVESNGCSKPAFFEVDGEEDFTHCCDHHDTCYATCGISRSFCEKEFKTCLTNLCDSVFAHNPKCTEAAGTYTLGTGMFGETAFQDTQALHCMCIKNDNIESHYSKLFEEFYSKYAPEKKEAFFKKFSKFAVNTGTLSQPNFNKLRMVFFGLHQTYDAAIQHIGPRIGLNPPKPVSVQIVNKEKVVNSEPTSTKSKDEI